MKIINIEQIEQTANWLLKHLGFFFIPIAVGLMTLKDIIFTNWLTFFIVLLFSSFLGIIASGTSVQFVINRKQREVKTKSHEHII